MLGFHNLTSNKLYSQIFVPIFVDSHFMLFVQNINSGVLHFFNNRRPDEDTRMQIIQLANDIVSANPPYFVLVVYVHGLLIKCSLTPPNPFCSKTRLISCYKIKAWTFLATKYLLLMYLKSATTGSQRNTLTMIVGYTP